ncbi:MAG: YbgC/FadM family acyl-CoA thioesterase [Candidatus Omnitrophica bacterium]|nr:YbgC/FadM family acyl-CoA thioesterase [Candidatus Omnitrophota bacterium]
MRKGRRLLSAKKARENNMEKSCIEKKVYYHDTDCGGVVYYANYLKYFEEGRSEYLLNNGISLKELAEGGVYFAVAHTQADYQSPARYQDILQVSTAIEKIGKCSIDFLQQISMGSKLLVEAKTTLVCINKDFKPIALLQSVRDKITSSSRDDP